MPNPFTPAQREALAKLVGINDNTHPHLFTSQDCEVTTPNFQPGESIRYETYKAVFVTVKIPCPLTGGAEADDVWLAPLMRHLEPRYQFGVGPSRSNTIEAKWAARMGYSSEGFSDISFAASPAAALLLASRAAGVEQVVAIFEMEKETEI